MQSRWVIIGIATIMSAPLAAAQSAQAVGPPDDAFLLVQSELASLEVAEERITIAFKDCAPVEALRRLSEMVSLSVSVERALPREPRLTASFKNATVKEVLEWFAGETGASYRVERTDRLLIFGRPTSQPGGGAEEAD